MFSIIVSTIFNAVFGTVNKEATLSCFNYKFVIEYIMIKKRAVKWISPLFSIKYIERL
jgi:hypothetical protein